MFADFEDFYNQKFSFVYNAALSYLFDKTVVEDVVQEVFTAAFRKFNKLQKHENVNGWLIVTMKNQANKSIKKLMPLEHECFYFDNYGLLEIIPLDFPEADRILLDYYYTHKYSISHLAKMEGISENAIRVRLCRARARLRECLDQGGEASGCE